MITLDLDNKSRRKATNAALFLKVILKLPTRLRESSSRKGWHVKAFLLDWPMEDQLKLRKLLGDDPRRIQKDRQRIKIGAATQILFTSKNNLESTKWVNV